MIKYSVPILIVASFLNCGKNSEWVQTNVDEIYGSCSKETLKEFQSGTSAIQPRDYCNSVHDGFAGGVKCDGSTFLVECKLDGEPLGDEKISLYLGYRYINAPTGLKLREAGSTTAKEVGELPHSGKVAILEEAGATVSISGREGRWTRVKFNDQIGWTFGGFLSKEKSSTPGKESNESTKAETDPKPTTDSSSEKSIGDRYIAVSVLRVRKGPGTNYPQVGNLNRNTKVELLKITDKEESHGGVSGKWKKIRHGKTVGYVFGGFLSEEKIQDSSSKPQNQTPPKPEKEETPDTLEETENTNEMEEEF